MPPFLGASSSRSKKRASRRSLAETDGCAWKRTEAELQASLAEVRKRQALAEQARTDQAALEDLLSHLSGEFVGAAPDQIDPLITRSLEKIRISLGLDRCVVWQMQSIDLFVVRHASTAPGVVTVRPEGLRADQVPWLWACLSAGQDVCVPSLDHLPPEAAQDARWTRDMWVGSHLLIPLRAASQVMGALACASVQAGFDWSERLQQRLGFIATTFAAALARKKAHEELVERLQFEEILTDLSAGLSSTRSDALGQAIHQMLGRTCQLLRCHRGALLEFADNGVDLIVTRVHLEPGARPYTSEDRVTASWYRTELRKGRVLALGNCAEEVPEEASREREYVDRERVASHLAIPMLVRGKNVGAIAFESLGEARAWPTDLIGRVGLLGDLIGNALDWRHSEAAMQELRNNLAHVCRVMTVGELTAAIAHELNQPLTAIVSNAHAGMRFLARPVPDLREIRDILEDVAADATRGGEIIQRLREFLRRGIVAAGPLDLGEAVEEVGRLVANEAALRRVILEVCVSRPLPAVAGDRVQLQQVLLNLVMNALEAMEHMAGGTRRLSITCGLRGAQVVVTVDDTGPGLPETGSCIFKTFVTTKVDGMGMGLSIARSIVEAHGGALVVVPRNGAGACFEMRLPSMSPPG